ncbi:MAG: SDR family NAD(P)-dependent oxidoreductase [Candidatus Angelobacter sp.]
MNNIAIIGMACRYAEANSPAQLWENVLSQRQSFRRIPQVRLNLADYSSDVQNDDHITETMAAVLCDYEFDRPKFHISRDAFSATDLTHWLALDVASAALEDASLLNAGSERLERTAVYVGNSLTGEFSRANLMRLRWPYVRRVLSAAFQANGAFPLNETEELLSQVEELYKAPFPATNEESLSGGLSNTIAGRICNYFDFKGGGYTVDGACASSLLAIATACTALQSGDVDIAVAGGVDLSLDPFELAGFSRLGALARDKMRVFDVDSSGFWPGEGCGMVVLMREEDAREDRHLPYAVIRGWGISSDGHGGITRPEITGQMLALQRAYRKSGYGIDSVEYFEGHGTGTSIGDATELQALSRLRREAASDGRPAALGSIKANVGHTKAAAGVAGLIKATMAVHHGILPPTTGCDRPHAELSKQNSPLRVLREGELWPVNVPRRAGVNGFGFGGINVHVTLEAVGIPSRHELPLAEQEQISSAQDSELFIFADIDREGLSRQLREVLSFAEECSYSELTDLSIFLAKRVSTSVASSNSFRGACIASSPAELHQGIKKLIVWCEGELDPQIDIQGGVFFGKCSSDSRRIGFLFPGQASPVYTNGGIWNRRFPFLRELYGRANLPQKQSVATEVAQPCIVTASLAGLRVLEMFGMEGSVSVGHSLGEITALHWAGACLEAELIRIVHARGKAMALAGEPSGAMASIRASCEEVRSRLNGDNLVVAAQNAPRQTVVSGDAGAVRRFTEKLRSHGINATLLPVSHAFHSPGVAGVAAVFSEHLSSEQFGTLQRPVISTVTGERLHSAYDLRTLLIEQITKPVRFAEAISIAADEVDLLIEVGPGTVLSGISNECTEKPIIALDAGSESLRGLFLAVGAAFVMGAEIQTSPLFEGRFGRHIDLTKKHIFLANPCETIPASVSSPGTFASPIVRSPLSALAKPDSALNVLISLVARRTQLPAEAIQPAHRFLTDLHLNSITISQIVLEAANQLALPSPAAPAEFTNATLAEAAAALESLRSQVPGPVAAKNLPGVDAWIRVLRVELLEKPLSCARVIAEGKWNVVADEQCSLVECLRMEFRSVPGEGLVCCVPQRCDDRTAAFLLQSAQAALKDNLPQAVFVQHGTGATAGALARSLFLENPGCRVTVVNVPFENSEAAIWAASEASTNQSFVEAYYDDSGIRSEPRLNVLWPHHDSDFQPLGPDDVLLVTGGAKGIAAESALHLAQRMKCRLALLGRSEPDTDHELQNNLRRFAESGVSFSYFKADVTDGKSVKTSLRQISSKLGDISAILHGAGANRPKRLEEITSADLNQIFAPKLTGLHNLLANIDPEKLRLLLTFGSIIGRTGLHGEAHYGLVNEWLNLTIQRWQKDHPRCRCHNLEWSVWAGIGMGQRLGVLESLARQGITPLPLDNALEQLQAMLEWNRAPVSSIITGRFGGLSTLKFEASELPLMRFLEHPRLHYPGIELIADAELSIDNDPYVTEHCFQGELLLPAVLGMEAMAQVAMALEQSAIAPTFRNLHFEHPIVIPRDKSVTIRIATLRRRPGQISVAIRCSSTGFNVDHFSGECVFEDKQVQLKDSAGSCRYAKSEHPSSAQEFYGRIFFHSGRFRRIESYELLRSDKSTATLNAPADKPWFARHLSGKLVMGDAASRDAALHSIQACIPHKTILPVGIDRVVPTTAWTGASARVFATERTCDGDNFVYDVRIEDRDGKVCEQWEGLHLRAVAAIHTAQSWPLALLVPYLERSLKHRLTADGIRIGLTNAPAGCSEDALGIVIQQIFGVKASLKHRPDGKPEIAGADGRANPLSISHCDGVTLLFSGCTALGCDMEKIGVRESACWEELLGHKGHALAIWLANELKVTLDMAATQIWTLKESLRKAGASLMQPISFMSRSPDGWATFSAGGFRAATFHTRIEEAEHAVAFGFVVKSAS